MSLSHLARLALNGASASPPTERAEVYRVVAAALRDDCPDLADLATKAASHLHTASESENQFLNLLKS